MSDITSSVVNNEAVRREIKSFVLRQGKITPGQQRALEELMPHYGLEYSAQPLDLAAAFGRVAPQIIEIGFGMGHATWQIAQNNPTQDYLGIEVHLPGVGSLLLQAEEQQVTNLRVIRHDAVEVLRHAIASNSIAGFHIFFPDPWHKKRHHKRRIIQQEFVELLVSRLQVGGYIHLATDWEDYAQWMLSVLNSNRQLKNMALAQDGNEHFVSRPAWRPLTKFEQRGIRLGHGVWDLLFQKTS